MAEREEEGPHGRLRRVEALLAEADRLLQRRRVGIGGGRATDFEDRLLQGVRDLAAADGAMARVSQSHATELADTAAHLDEPPRRARRG